MSATRYPAGPVSTEDAAAGPHFRRQPLGGQHAMTETSLLAALATGLLIGIVGYRVGRNTRLVPIWLPPAVGIGAALLATVVARRAGIDSLRVSPVEVGLQLGLAT